MRLIDADSLIATLQLLDCETNNMKEKSIVEFVLHKVLPKIINDEPTADAQPVKCGRWYYDNARDQCFCTECGNYTYIDKSGNEIISNYCPDCGAKMEN